MEWWQRAVVLQIYPRSYRGLRRRRRRRPPRPRSPARVPRVARRRRALAEPDLPVAERRLGLRRRRLPRRPSRARHARGHGRAARRGRARAASGSSSTSSPTTPRSSTRGSGAARDSRATGTSGPTRRRTGPAEQLAVGLRRLGVGAVDEPRRPVLPAQLPARASPTSTGGTRSVRAEFEDILRFWFDRGVAGFRIDVAHALVQDRQLRDNSPARPGDDGDAAAYRPAARPQPEPAEVHDVYRALARGSPTAYEPSRGAARRDVRDGARAARRRSTAGRDELHLGVQLHVPPRRPRRRRAARDASSGPRRRSPTTRGRSGRRRTTTWRASRPRWADGDDAARPRVALRDAADAPRDARPLLRRRAPAPERRRARRGAPRPGRARGRPPSTAGTASRTPMPWEPGAGVRVHRRAEPWLPIGDHDGRDGRRAARRPGSALSPRARPDRAAALARGPRERRLRDDPVPAGDLGLAARRADRRRAQPRRRPGRARARRHDPARHAAASATASASTGRSRSSRREGVVLELEPA